KRHGERRRKAKARKSAAFVTSYLKHDTIERFPAQYNGQKTYAGESKDGFHASICLGKCSYYYFIVRPNARTQRYPQNPSDEFIQTLTREVEEGRAAIYFHKR